MTASRRNMLAHGIIAGTIGYAVVAVLFGLVDYLYGRPVYATAAYLGARITAAVVPAFAATPVLAFNALHLVLMLAAGILGSRLVHRWPHAGFLPFFAFIAAVFAALIASFALAAGLLGAASAIDIVWINLAAAAAVTSYLLVGPVPVPRGHIDPA
jgi:hypothetical protein